jgi:hypothetical protein
LLAAALKHELGQLVNIASVVVFGAPAVGPQSWVELYGATGLPGEGMDEWPLRGLGVWAWAWGWAWARKSGFLGFGLASYSLGKYQYLCHDGHARWVLELVVSGVPTGFGCTVFVYDLSVLLVDALEHYGPWGALICVWSNARA